MKQLATAIALAALFGAASAHETIYHITTTFYEPQTQPKNSIFDGSFVYDPHTKAVSGLTGLLSESMTGSSASTMNWLSLTYQLESWYDGTLGGTFAAVFRNSNTHTFWTGLGGDGWSPEAGVAVGGVYYGYPAKNANPGNAYALIFVPDNPLATLTQAQIDKLAYADCAPGGMMMAVCMTGTSMAGYGSAGTMDGFPVAQTITAAVPEPGSSALMAGGLALLGWSLHRRRPQRA